MLRESDIKRQILHFSVYEVPITGRFIDLESSNDDCQLLEGQDSRELLLNVDRVLICEDEKTFWKWLLIIVTHVNRPNAFELFTEKWLEMANL